MHSKKTMALATCGLLVLLSGCGPSRAEKDARLQTLCYKLVMSLYDTNDKVDVQEARFSSKVTDDKMRLRIVHLTARHVRNQGMIKEKNYSCAFEESLFALGYQPHFYNIDRDDGIRMGYFDGIVEGTLDDIANFSKMVEDEAE